MILDIIDTANNLIEPFRSFIIEHHDNPILWTAIIIVGLAVFGFTYNALHRD